LHVQQLVACTNELAHLLLGERNKQACM